MPVASGIYAIIHCESGRWYVGQSQNLRKRFSQHRSSLARGVHRNRHLQNAWKRYGPESFDFDILILAPVGMLDDLEQAYLDDPETSHFNVARDAAATARGLKLSAEACAKISASKIGRPRSAGHIAKMIGRPVSAATRAKMRATMVGRKLSDDHKARISAAQSGRPGGRRNRNNTSGFKGASWNKVAKKWSAKITYNHKTKYLGYFSSAEAAARAYDAEARRLHGPFAVLNFPDESD